MSTQLSQLAFSSGIFGPPHVVNTAIMACVWFWHFWSPTRCQHSYHSLRLVLSFLAPHTLSTQLSQLAFSSGIFGPPHVVNTAIMACVWFCHFWLPTRCQHSYHSLRLALAFLGYHSLRLALAFLGYHSLRLVLAFLAPHTLSTKLSYLAFGHGIFAPPRAVNTVIKTLTKHALLRVCS